MEIKLYNSPKRAFKLILVSSGFLAFALFILATVDAPTWTWYLSIGVYGLVYPIALFHLFDRRPQVVISEFGIFDRRTCKDFINWEVIKRAWAQDEMVVSDVCLLVDDKYLPSLKKAAVNRPRMIYPEIRAHLVVISVGQLAVDPFKLAEFIMKMSKLRPENRKEKLKDRRLM